MGSHTNMESDVHSVLVSVVQDEAGFNFSFSPEIVEVHEKKCKVIYQFDDTNTFGLVFSGAVFPQTQEHEAEHINTNGILEDIKSFKVKDSGKQLTISNRNKKHGLIGLNLLFCTTDGKCYESKDPQIKNGSRL